MLSLDQIVNILTLRYDPNSTTSLKKLSWKDFHAKSSTYDIELVSNILRTSILSFVEQNKIKKISLALSGGIDSLLTLSFFRESCPDVDITCLCASFKAKDPEIKYSKLAAQKFNCDFHPIHLNNFLNNLPMQISIVKEPKWHYYWYFIAKEAKKFSNYLISGDGGDELFGGYVFRYNKFLHLTKSEKNWKVKIKNYLECHNRDWVVDQSLLFGPKIHFSWDNIYSYFSEFFNNSLNPLDQVFLADYNGKLRHDWIPALEKIHDYFKLKGFMPILNDQLINYSCTIPTNQKYDFLNNKGKLIFREILTARKLTIQEGKRGFSPDLFGFWKNFGKEIVSSYLDDARIVREGFVNEEWIIKSKKIVREKHDIRYINKLLSVLSFEIWYRLFVSKELKSTDQLL